MGLGDIKDKGEEKENDNLEIRANAKGLKHGKKRAKTREQRGFGMAWDKVRASPFIIASFILPLIVTLFASCAILHLRINWLIIDTRSMQYTPT